MKRSERLAALEKLFAEFDAPPPGYPNAPADFTAHDDDSEDAPWITWLSDKVCPYPAMIGAPAIAAPTEPEAAPEPEPVEPVRAVEVVEAAPEPVAEPEAEPHAPRIEHMYPSFAAAKLLLDIFAPAPADAAEPAQSDMTN